MCSQRKMPAFPSNFLANKIFRKLKVFADFRVNHPKFLGNSVFCLNDISPRNEVKSARKKSHGSPSDNVRTEKRYLTVDC